MQPRAPTRAVTRTYVKTVRSPGDRDRYQASVVVARTRETLTATRDSLLAAVGAARKRAGVRS